MHASLRFALVAFTSGCAATHSAGAPRSPTAVTSTTVPVSADASSTTPTPPDGSSTAHAPGDASSTTPLDVPLTQGSPEACGSSGIDVAVRALPTRATGAPSPRGSCPEVGPGGIAHSMVLAIGSAAAFRAALSCEPPDGFDFTRERIVAVRFTTPVDPPGNDTLVLRSVKDDGRVVRMRFYESGYCGGATPVIADVTRLYALPVGRPLAAVLCATASPCSEYAVP